MTETTRAQCPACGANIDDDGRSGVIECRYCRTKVALRRDPPAPPPRPAPRPPEPRLEPPARVELSHAFDADEVHVEAPKSGCGSALAIAAGVGTVAYLAYAVVITNFFADMDAWNKSGWYSWLFLFLGVPVLALIIMGVRRLLR